MEKNRITAFLEPYRVAIVTGGSSGIGECFIRTVLPLNENLIVCNLSRSQTEGFSKERRVLHLGCDLTDQEQLGSALRELKQLLGSKIPEGRILLVNNSGFGSYGYFQKKDLQSELNMIDLNVRACVALAGKLLPEMLERGGMILNVASTAAFQATPYMATYGATKAFLMHWSLALDQDLRGTGVRSVALCPGPTATRFFERAGFSEPPRGTSGHTCDEVIATTLEGMVKGRRLIVCGLRNRMLAAVSSKLPPSVGSTVTAAFLRKLRLEQHQRESEGKEGAPSE